VKNRFNIVLARTAESLFWMGRYLERSEATARLLDVHLHDLIGTTTTQQKRWTNEIQAMVAMEQIDEPFEALAMRLSIDRDHPSSIICCMEKAWENAKSARDAISLELWESINVTYSRLLRTFITDLGHSPHAYYAWIKDRSAAARGLGDTTMNRDQAWLFLHMGRAIEQIDLTTRLLRVKLLDPNEEDWVVVLRCIGGHEAYIRAVQRPVEKELAITFLLRETLFPKSVLYLNLQLESALLSLSRNIRDLNASDIIPPSLARLIARLSYPRVGEMTGSSLLERIDEITETQSDLFNLFNSTFFSPLRDLSKAIPQRSEVWI
ncbi:unnamed protein product, partial [Acidithrix sp. C25]